MGSDRSQETIERPGAGQRVSAAIGATLKIYSATKPERIVIIHSGTVAVPGWLTTAAHASLWFPRRNLLLRRSSPPKLAYRMAA